MIWIHIDFFFHPFEGEDDFYLTKDEQFMFEELVRKILRRIRPFIRRKFYLYEPQPNVFLALEVKQRWFIPFIAIVLFCYRNRCRFIRQACIHSVSGYDERNGEGFCDVINAMTDYYLFKKDAKLTHLIHCCLEFQHQTREKEVEFYKTMLELYDPNHANRHE